MEAGVVVVQDQTILKKFSSYVKPATFPRLTEKCKQFLGITQNQVDQGISFNQLVHDLTPFPKEVSHLWQTVIGMLLSISNRKDYAY
jgi:sporulation inhibitor KapD